MFFAINNPHLYAEAFVFFSNNLEDLTHFVFTDKLVCLNLALLPSGGCSRWR